MMTVSQNSNKSTMTDMITKQTLICKETNFTNKPNIISPSMKSRALKNIHIPEYKSQYTKHLGSARLLNLTKLNAELVFDKNGVVVEKECETLKALQLLRNHMAYNKESSIQTKQNNKPPQFYVYQHQSMTEDKTHSVIFAKTNEKLPSQIRKSIPCAVCKQTIHVKTAGYPNDGVSYNCDTGLLLIGKIHGQHTEDHAPLVRRVQINSSVPLFDFICQLNR